MNPKQHFILEVDRSGILLIQDKAPFQIMKPRFKEKRFMTPNGDAIQLNRFINSLTDGSQIEIKLVKKKGEENVTQETMLICPKCKSSKLSQKHELSLFKCSDCQTEYVLVRSVELTKDELF